MTIQKIGKPPEDWPKAPGRSYWARDDKDVLLIVGTRTIGKVMPSHLEGMWEVWGRTSLEGGGDCTGAFDTFADAMDALVEHVEEYRLCNPKPEPVEEIHRATVEELVREIRLKAALIGAMATSSAVLVLTRHFIDAAWLLAVGSSAALAAGIMAFTWRAEAGRRDG
jgi:hypothetical protein